MESTIEAGDVTADVFLPGLGNGYVIDVDHYPDVRGGYNTRLGGEDYVLITFNCDQGDEHYLLCASGMLLTVRD